MQVCYTLKNTAHEGALSSEQQQQLTRPFDQFIQGLERQTLIAVIRFGFMKPKCQLFSETCRFCG